MKLKRVHLVRTISKFPTEYLSFIFPSASAISVVEGENNE